jgi:RNA polymerase sigma-70 factor (ECF subfamily)
MHVKLPRPTAALELDDTAVITRVLAGEVALFELIIRRYNQRLFRVARAIVKDDSDAEDVMQEAYVKAYSKLATFRGEAKFSTWLTKIAVYEALGRARKRGDLSIVDEESMMADAPSPEHVAFSSELRGLLEQALQTLPSGLRVAYMLREVEGLSGAEAAACLAVSEDALKMRLSRAKAMLRAIMHEKLDSAVADVFTFHAPRCDRMVELVFARIRG